MAAGLTLYVTHSDRAPDVVTDGIAAARWASQHTCLTLVVVAPGQAELYAKCGADLVLESSLTPARDDLLDFRFYEGIKYAIDCAVEFEQVICFRDDAMFLQRGVDDLISRTFYKETADLLGVADRHYYGENFMQLGRLFSQWRVPHEVWDKPPQTFTAHSAVFALTHKLARELFYRRLLTPPRLDEWPLSFGAYASWICQLLLMPQLLRGSIDRPAPPFYVNDGWGGAYNPPPYLLHPNIALYWSLRRIAGYSESETRTWCRSFREVNA
jgi:hypothetical protein